MSSADQLLSFDLLAGLYDNPISLEPNYRKIIIFSCKSLDVFDRNSELTSHVLLLKCG